MENDMRKLLGAIVISVAALAATSAFPENVVSEQRAELERVWDNTQVRSASPDDFLGRIFSQVEFGFVNPGMAEVGSDYGRSLRSDPRYGNSAWSGNFRGGLVHEPGGD
jgi:hypothetical protein